MVKQRTGHAIVINALATRRIKEDKCPGCGKPKNKWKRSKTWRCCSTECTIKYQSEMVIWGWQQMRQKVFERDNYTCKMCSRRPTEIYHPWLHSPIEDWREHVKNFKRFIAFSKQQGKEVAILKDPSQLIGDHIHAIALGGEEWDMGNIQTLCKECNRKKTKEDAGRIALLRQVERKLVPGQKQLI